MLFLAELWQNEISNEAENANFRNINHHILSHSLMCSQAKKRKEMKRKWRGIQIFKAKYVR